MKYDEQQSPLPVLGKCEKCGYWIPTDSLIFPLCLRCKSKEPQQDTAREGLEK
jgi:predicted Zn-ribbon and HTH transcriptional regulator